MAQTTQHKQTEEMPPTVEQGWNLAAMLFAILNSLKLTRDEILSWTNDTGRLRALMQILKDKTWQPPQIGTKVEVINPGLCTHEDLGTEAAEWDANLRDTWAYFNRSNEGKISEILDRQFLPDSESGILDTNVNTRSNVVSCRITTDPEWGVNVLRSMFKYDGPEEYLTDAFIVRKTVWPLRWVINYVIRLIHDPADDPLNLLKAENDIWFPYFSGSVSQDGKILSTEHLRKNIKFIRLRQSHEKYLATNKWNFRTIYSLGHFLDWKRGYGDSMVEKDDVFIFRNSPLPRARPQGFCERNTALYGV